MSKKNVCKKVFREVCNSLNLDFEKALLNSGRRNREYVEARQIASYILKEKYCCPKGQEEKWYELGKTRITLNEIGRYFGGKHHSTVLHSHRTVLDQMKYDKVFREKVTNIKNDIDNANIIRTIKKKVCRIVNILA